MFTFVVILVLGVLSRQYLGRALRLPYTVILMVLGALTGLLIENRRNAFELNLKSWYDMTPQVILYCFVPILVFESAFMTDTHIFSRQKWQILTLAGPGVLVASILTGGFVKAVFTDYGWDWPTVLMFGAMMSATDPVAVVALLNAVSAHHGTGGASPLTPLPTSSTSSSAFAAPLHSGDFFGERSKQEKRPSTRDRLSEEMRQQLAASSDEGRTQSARRVSFAEAGVEMTARAPTSFGDDDGRSSRGGSEASSSTPGFARRVFDGVAARFASAPKSPPSTSPDSGTFAHSDPKGPAYAPLRVSSLSRSSSSSTVEGGREMLAESRARCLWAIKANYHVAFTHGRLTPHGLRVLVENVDMQTDDESRPLDEWERLEAHDLWPKARLSRIQYLRITLH